MSIWLSHTPPLTPSSSSALILIIPVKLETAPCTHLCFFPASYRPCHSPWQGRQETQHSFSVHKGRPVRLDKYYFPLLTASPVKLVLYCFLLSFSPLMLFPLIITLPMCYILKKGFIHSLYRMGRRFSNLGLGTKHCNYMAWFIRVCVWHTYTGSNCEQCLCLQQTFTCCFAKILFVILSNGV